MALKSRILLAAAVLLAIIGSACFATYLAASTYVYTCIHT